MLVGIHPDRVMSGSPLVMLATALGLFGGRTWAGVTALVIALDVWVIWALTRPGVVEA